MVMTSLQGQKTDVNRETIKIARLAEDNELTNTEEAISRDSILAK